MIFLYTYRLHTYIISILLAFIMPATMFAQQLKVTGQVVTLEDYTPVPNVLVSLLDKDSVNLKTVTANENGEFLFNVEKKGNYIVKAMMIGYKPNFKAFRISSKTTAIPLLRLEEDNLMLDSITVTGNLPKVQQVEDTLLYNADAYRLPEGSVLEELIQRLPGARVVDGKVTINGREVKKILLDGKEFFAKDMETALKNLPTSIIDKLKHFDEKSDMAKVTGIDDGQEQPVLDVRIKKGMNIGYNVNSDAGYGTHDRYYSRMNANSFMDNMKLSFMGNANNSNERGTPSRGYGGGGSGGLRSHKSLGLNVNFDNTKTLQMDGNVIWAHRDNDNMTKQSSENFVSRVGAFSNSLSQDYGRTDGWNTSYRIEWKPTKEWNILIRPTASISTNDRLAVSTSASFNSDPYLFVTDPLAADAPWGDADTIRVNRRVHSNVAYSRNRNIGTSVQVNRKFGDKGRNLTFRSDFNYSDSKGNSVSRNMVTLFKMKQQDGRDSVYYTNRYNQSPGRKQNYSLQLAYSEPIVKNTFLQASYTFQYRKDNSDRRTYDFSALRGAFGEGIVPAYGCLDRYLASVDGNIDDYISKSLSRYSEYHNYIHDINLQLRLVREDYHLSFGLRYVPQSSHYRQDYRNIFVDTIRHTSTLTPMARFRYRFSKQKTINFDYSGRTQHPSITQLLDITDDANPLYISKGNPALKPSFTNTMNIRYNNYVNSRRQSINADLLFSTTSNSISNKVTYNEKTGGTITQPENINGNWNLNGNFMFNSALDKEANWNASTSTSVNYSNYVSYLSLDNNSDSEKNTTKTVNANEELMCSYRNSWFEMELNADVELTSGRNKLQSNADRDTWHYSYGCSFNIRLPWNMTLDTNVYQSMRRGYSNADFNTTEMIWNAQITQQLLSHRRLVVTLQFYDILGQQSNFSRNLTANRRSDTEYNSVNSYAMLHVVYQLRNFGGKKGRMGNGQRGGGRGGYDRKGHNGPRNRGGGHGGRRI